MAMRVSGINSGLDTDAIVQELVSAYSKKTEKYEKEQTKLSWKQDIWKSLNSKVYSLYTNISKLRFSSAYAIKKVTSSDTSKATVTASGEAVNGTQKLNVKQTAQSAYLTGAKVNSTTGEKVTSKTKLSDLGFDTGDEFNTGASLRVKTKDADGNETSTTIQLKKDSTVGDVVNQLREAGLNASFDEKQGRFYISSKTSGKNGDFTIEAATKKQVPVWDENHDWLKDKDGNIVYEEVYTTAAEQSASNWLLDSLGLGGGNETVGGKALIVDVEVLDAEGNLTGTTRPETATTNAPLAALGITLPATLKLTVNGKEKEIDIPAMTKTGQKEDDGTTDKTRPTTIRDVLNLFEEQGVNAGFDETSGQFVFQKSDNVTFASDNADLLGKLGLDGVLVGRETLAGGKIVARNGSTAALTTPGSNLGVPADGTRFNVKFGGQTHTISVDTNTRISDILEQFGNAGINVKFDGATGQFVFQNGNALEFEAVGADGSEAKEASNALLKRLGLTNSDGTKALAAREDRTPHKIDGEDAVILLNGVEYTNNTNEFSINGLNITAQGVTGDDPNNAITINVNTDTQGLYDTVKDFLTQYNNIINEITKLYNADTAKGYEPLTDEEKDAMNDTEIEKWETKIKDSLLRRDSSLNAIMSAMINSMNKGIVINGKTYALSTFGIHTMGFLNAVENEQNAFHIDGDEEDENTANNEEKLMKAIKEEPDTVIEFMKQLTSNLYKAIDDQMKGNSMRTRYKIYNDKEMDKQYKEYTKTISEWEKKVSAKEDYYYKKFSAMETALAKLNSQQSSLAGLLGSK